MRDRVIEKGPRPYDVTDAICGRFVRCKDGSEGYIVSISTDPGDKWPVRVHMDGLTTEVRRYARNGESQDDPAYDWETLLDDTAGERIKETYDVPGFDFRLYAAPNMRLFIDITRDRITFSPGAVGDFRLQEWAYISLLWDQRRSTIGFRKCSPDKSGGFQIGPDGYNGLKGRRKRPFDKHYITCPDFISRFGILPGESTLRIHEQSGFIGFLYAHVYAKLPTF